MNNRIWIRSSVVSMCKEWLEKENKLILVYSKEGWTLCGSADLYQEVLKDAPYIILWRKRNAKLSNRALGRLIVKLINSPIVMTNFWVKCSICGKEFHHSKITQFKLGKFTFECHGCLSKLKQGG